MNRSPIILDKSLYKNPDNDPRGPYLLTHVTSPSVRSVLQYEWHGQLPPEGRSWRYMQKQAFELEAEGRIVLTATGAIRLKRYLSEVRLRPGDAPDSRLPKIELILRTAMREIAMAIAENPSFLQEIEWRDLERVLREVFEKLGFATELTRSTKDGGFDLRLQCLEGEQLKTFIVEVKHWAGSGKRPGRPVLDALFEVLVKRGEAATGLLLSSTGFTGEIVRGRTEVERHAIRLGGKEKIVSLCQNYLENVSGIWTPMTSLSDMLLDGTH